MTSFAERVIEERLKLAEADPEGEAEAVHPIDYVDALRFRVGTVDSLARAGYTGPDAETRYIEGDPPDDYEEPPEIAEAMAALPKVQQHPPFRSIADIPEPDGVDDYLIDGVLRPRSLVILAAAEGVGKSYVRLEMGLRLAVGSGALFGHYPILRQARVMVLNCENDPAEEWERERQALGRLGVERESVTEYLRADVRDFALVKGETWIASQLAEHQPDVLVIDTGTSAVDDEWGPAFKSSVRALRGLGDRYGVAIIVCVHLTKPPKEPGRGVHGTSLAAVMGQWTRQADAVALMADLGEGRAQWTMRKRVPHSSIVIAQDEGLWQYVASVNERRPSTDDRILHAIASGADAEDALTAALGLRRSAVYAALGRLRVGGFLEHGTPYRLTDDGREAVA